MASQKTRTYPAVRRTKHLVFHYLGDSNKACRNINVLRNLRDELDDVILQYDGLRAEGRKPAIVKVPSTGTWELSYLAEPGETRVTAVRKTPR